MAVDTIHRAHHAGGVTFTASKGLGATDGVNTPALQGLSSIAGVITSLVRAGCGTTADTVLLAGLELMAALLSKADCSARSAGGLEE